MNLDPAEARAALSDDLAPRLRACALGGVIHAAVAALGLWPEWNLNLTAFGLLLVQGLPGERLHPPRLLGFALGAPFLLPFLLLARFLIARRLRDGKAECGNG